MSIEGNIKKLKAVVPDEVKIVAISKFHSNDEIMQAYNAGQRIFGESRVQELTEKVESLPEDIEWHFVGGLQRNKVRQIAPFVSMIHSVDSVRLIREIDKRADVNNRVIPCLLQIHIADEDTKSGFSIEECRQLFKEEILKEFKNIKISGLMGMATFTDDEDKIRKEFGQLKSLFDELSADYFADDSSFKEISMGMTGDYPIAIEMGSTMIRVGTLIFGERKS